MSESNVTTVRGHLNNLTGLGVVRMFTVFLSLVMIAWLIVWINGNFQETTRSKETLAIVGMFLGALFVTSTYLMIYITGSLSNIAQALAGLLEERERNSHLISLLTDVTYTALTEEGKEANDVMLATIIYRITEGGLAGKDKVYYDFLWRQKPHIRMLVIQRCVELSDSAWSELVSSVNAESVRPTSTRTIHGFTAEIDRLQTVIGRLQTFDNS